MVIYCRLPKHFESEEITLMSY